MSTKKTDIIIFGPMYLFFITRLKQLEPIMLLLGFSLMLSIKVKLVHRLDYTDKNFILLYFSPYT